jgi:hypothetical protein
VLRIRGRGLLVIPNGSFRFERDEVPTASTERVEVLAAPASLEWRIETDTCSIAWPAGFALANDPDELSPFLLHGPGDALLWIAGPLPRDKVLPVEKLVTEDQRVRAIADAGDDVRIDVDYIVDDGDEPEPWWQRRYVRVTPQGAFVLSAQAHARDEDVVRAAIDEIERTFAPSAPA